MRRRSVRLTEQWAVFGACSAVYVTLGALLAFHFASFNGDAQSRLANAYYVLFSRDPHLAAIGFVWNPLPSALLLPVLPLKLLWPALSNRAFAGNIESAAFMGGSVCVLRLIVRDLRLPQLAGWLVVVAFALNPMILYYGANGMSEALFLFTLLLATLHLMRWLATESLRSLALAGVWLGIAYLAREEAVAAAAAVCLLVAGRTFLRTAGDRRQRVLAGLADAVIAGAPFIASFVGWAVVSFVITGHPFEQFSSQYGNSSQLQVIGNSISVSMSRPLYMAEQLLTYAPFLFLIVVVCATRMWRKRDPRFLAAVTVLGGVIGFSVLGYILGMTVGWYRYTIEAVPAAVVLAACCLSPGLKTADAHFGGRLPLGLERLMRGFDGRVARPAFAACIAAAVLLPSLPATAWGMSAPQIGREERLHLEWVVRGVRTEADQQERDRLDVSDGIAKYLDDMHLAKGKIILDTFTPCVPFIVLASRNPRQFVITNDRDFQPILADPVTFHAQYLLLPPDNGYGTLDAVNVAYPDLYDKGAGLATLVHEFTASSCPPFRLYKVTGSDPGTSDSSLPTPGGK